MVACLYSSMEGGVFFKEENDYCMTTIVLTELVDLNYSRIFQIKLV